MVTIVINAPMVSIVARLPLLPSLLRLPFFAIVSRLSLWTFLKLFLSILHMTQANSVHFSTHINETFPFGSW
jgi:hypothetical protein